MLLFFFGCFLSILSFLLGGYIGIEMDDISYHSLQKEKNTLPSIIVRVKLFEKTKGIKVMQIKKGKLPKFFKKKLLPKDFKPIRNKEILQNMVSELMKNNQLFCVRRLKLDVILSMEDAVVTANLVAGISIFISFLLGQFGKTKWQKDYQYQVKPEFASDFMIAISGNVIFEFSVFQLIKLVGKIAKEMKHLRKVTMHKRQVVPN